MAVDPGPQPFPLTTYLDLSIMLMPWALKASSILSFSHIVWIVMTDRSVQSSKSFHRPIAIGLKIRVLGTLLVAVVGMAGCASSAVVRRSADDWFELGQRELARGKYTKAEEAFSKFLEQHPQDRRRPEALMGLADAIYGDKRYEEAKFQYRRFLELFPASTEAATAQFNSAMCSFHRMKTIDRDQSTTQEAVQEFQRLIQFYPHSPYVAQAEEKLAESRERLASYELYVGRFYYRQAAYPAAIGRFEGLLKAYPEVSFADEVFFLLGNAYERSDHPQEATTAFDELVTRYPQSRYANQAKARLASSR
jgi:outer membrane protein assembly factor BamD